VGLVGKQIVRDADGTEDALSIFLLAPYAVVSEEDIISERTPMPANARAILIEALRDARRWLDELLSDSS